MAVLFIATFSFSDANAKKRRQSRNNSAQVSANYHFRTDVPYIEQTDRLKTINDGMDLYMKSDTEGIVVTPGYIRYNMKVVSCKGNNVVMEFTDDRDMGYAGRPTYRYYGKVTVDPSSNYVLRFTGTLHYINVSVKTNKVMHVSKYPFDYMIEE